MDIVALDGTKLLILMLSGGIFAVAGIWLLFRPPTNGEAAKIELFGLKFQSSSAGLLVFLIGAAFLAVPIFVPEKSIGLAEPAQAPPTVDRVRLAAASRIERTVPAAAGAKEVSGAAALGVPGQQFAVHADEQEPNDSHGNANILVPGTSVAGIMKSGDRDHFCIDIPPGVSGTLVVTLRTYSPSIELLDDVGLPIDSASACHETTTVAAQAPIERSRYCAVAAMHGSCVSDKEHPYHFSAAVRPD